MRHAGSALRALQRSAAASLNPVHAVEGLAERLASGCQVSTSACSTAWRGLGTSTSSWHQAPGPSDAPAGGQQHDEQQQRSTQHQHASSSAPHHHSRTVHAEEAAKFAALAGQWWDPAGPFKALHELNPARCRFIRTALSDALGRDPAAAAPLGGLRLLDVGCGGGILAESLAAMGAEVTGIDVNEAGLETARAHAALDPGLQGLLTYRAATSHVLVEEGAQFDAVIASEVIEHVEEVPAFCASLAALARPGGAVVLSTMNRTPRAFALAVALGEYLLRWAPVGTHDWSRFITPEELVVLMARAGEAERGAGIGDGTGSDAAGSGGGGGGGGGLRLEQLAGMVFDPLSWRWRLSSDTAVNYIAAFSKPE